MIGGAKWPLGAAALDPADPRSLLVTLKEPVVGDKTGTARGDADLRYDGTGGLAAAGDGKAIGAFWSGAAPTTPRTNCARSGPTRSGRTTPCRIYPAPQLTRDAWRNLNGRWQFAAATAGSNPRSGRRSASTSSSRARSMPAVRRRTPRGPHVVPPHLHRPGRLAHRLGPTAPADFGAVDWQSEVYVNGVRVAEHRGGYDKFGVDVTDALKPGRSQELIVGVYDPTNAASGENPPLGKQRLDPSGIWYTPTSGIWQTVWMEPVAPDHVDSLKLTPDVDGGRLTVEPKGVRDGLPVTATAYEGGRRPPPSPAAPDGR